MSNLNPRGDIGLLHPVAMPTFLRFTERLHKAQFNQEIKTWFNPFETYRSPVRQQQLYDSRANGRQVTKAKPWESAHQFGMAVDYVPYMPKPNSTNLEREWNWDSSFDWDYIAHLVRTEFVDELYMEAPEWDPGHVTHLVFQDYKTIHRWWMHQEERGL